MANVLKYWTLIEADFQETYGLDIGGGLMRQRSWRWFSTRMYNLLTTPETRLRRVLYPPKDEKGKTPE